MKFHVGIKCPRDIFWVHLCGSDGRPVNTNICSSPSTRHQTGAPLSDIQGAWTHSMFSISDLLISRLCWMKRTLFACCFQPVIREAGLCLCAAPYSFVCSDTSCLQLFLSSEHFSHQTGVKAQLFLSREIIKHFFSVFVLVLSESQPSASLALQCHRRTVWLSETN